MRAEIESWPADVLADYARIIELVVEHGANLRMPHSRAFGNGLFELRPRGRTVAARALYCFQHRGRVVVLHAFVKKTRASPGRDLELARKRMRSLPDA